MKEFVKKHWLLLILLAISSIAYYRWLSFNIFFHSDWPYIWKQAIAQGLHPSLWVTNSYGDLNLVAPRIPIDFVQAAIGSAFHASSAVTDKPVFLWPVIFVLPITGYYIGWAFTKNKWASFSSGLVFAFNTYFLAIDTEGHILITLAAAFSVLGFMTLTKSLQTLSRKLLVSSILFFALASYYDFRIVYIVFFILIAYCIGLKIIKRLHKEQFIYLAIFFTVFIAASVFWLVPLYLSAGFSSDEILGRALFGENFWTLNNALALHHPFWTSGRPSWFVFQNPTVIFYLYPILAFGTLFFKRARVTYFFVLTALVGVLLSKQTNQPLTTLYPWLYNHLPGFNAFREATKFYTIILFAYAVLIGLFIKHSTDSKSKKIKKIGVTAIALLTLLSLFNLFPYLSGSIQTMGVVRHIPNDYNVLTDFITKQTGYFRTESVPSNSHLTYADDKHPEIGTVDLLGKNLPVLPETDDSQIFVDKYSNYLKADYTSAFSNLLSIKYFVVPLRDTANDDDFYKYYGDNRTYYLDSLNGLSWLKRIDIGTKSVAVYQNLNYKPYFTTATQLNKVDSFESVNNYYDFQSNALKTNSLNFVSSNDKGISAKTLAPTQSISDISVGLSANDVKTGQLKITKNLNPSNTNVLYANTAQVSYSYQISNENIKFIADNANDLQANSEDIGAALATNTLASATLLPDNNYVLAQGNALYKIDQYQTETRTIGATSDSLALYNSPSNINLITNGSFDNGLWQDKVEDCNDYDSSPNISMQRSTTVTFNSHYSLALGAYKHTACTSSNKAVVVSGNIYSLSYEYQIKNGERAGYDLIFNDPKHTVINADQIKGSGVWYNLYAKFTAPRGATDVVVRLKGYPDDQDKQHAITYYDSISLQPLNLVTNIVNSSTPQYKVSKIAYSTITATVLSNSFSYKNLISNPSLEDGLWQKKVGDCNAYDNKPLLSMELDGKSRTDGKQSLELDATRHVACTGPPAIKIQEGKSYLLSFDYQSPDATEAGYYVSFDDANGTVLSERLPINNQNWNTFTKTFVAPFGAKSMSLSVYSYADQYGGIKEINRYDNFSLLNIPAIQNRYYVVSTPKQVLKQPQHIAFELDSPTKKQVQVTGASTPFYLNMSESYHPQWRLELDDANSDGGLNGWSPKASPTAVPDVDHFNYDDFLNSWYVDPAKLCAGNSPACTKNADGSYNLKLIAEFAPQRYFYVGLIVSGVTLVGCVGYLLFAVVKPRRKLNKTKVFTDAIVEQTKPIRIKRDKPYKIEKVDKP